ncbi:SKP1 [Melia azedarach]|uniref:SKP1 n=1 Tax=Melia azedarach TaxID=155640 RepID=A0ACC1X3T1_MELAZ|nr:SKP1 [Melia azedarach]
MSEESSSAQAIKKISLKTADGQLFEVDEPVAMEFEIVKSFFDENEDATDDTVVPLPNVSAEPLSHIIEFCKAQVEFRKKRASKDEVKTFNNDFIKEKTNDQIKEMILVANYLNIKEMLDFLTETVANRIKNKSVEYVRKFFGIENDFTPEEEEAARKEYEWAFEGVDED